MIYDLEGSNNVDPLVNGFGQIFDGEIYLTDSFDIGLVKPAARAPLYPSSNHVCSKALAPVRMPCARAHVNQGVAISTGYGPL